MTDSSPPESFVSRRLMFWLLAVYWPLLFVSTHVPLPEGALPGGSDKGAHLVAYGILGGLLTGWQLSRNIGERTALVRTMLIAGLYGICDELLQIPCRRNAEVLDWLADVAGALLGAGAMIAVTQAWKSRGNPRGTREERP